MFMKYIQFLRHKIRIVFAIMLMENNTMNIKCHDYMEYIFYRNPLIENVLLPYGQEVNKYAFLIETSKIISFLDWNKNVFNYPFSIVCIVYNLEKVLNNELPYDNDIKQLYDSIYSQLAELQDNYTDNKSMNYNKLAGLFVEIGILYENIYLCKDDEDISCKELSFKINDVLLYIERKYNIRGILNGGYDATSKNYSFSRGINNIVNILRSYYDDYILAIINKSKLEKLEERFFMFYFEILLLVTNTYNEHIKGLYCNEW